MAVTSHRIPKVKVSRELLQEHFFAPRNVGDAAEPNYVGRSASFECGAVARVSLVIDESHNILQARFRAIGCDLLVASLSLLTEQVNGKTTAAAAELAQRPDEVGTRFGGIERHKTHCVELACEALLAAICQYSEAAREEWIGDEALICTCFFVSERTIEREIREQGLTTVAEVTRSCNAGGGCGSCHQLIQEILDGE
ncbi:MAG TPA: iron-sulfur cluster assembly scaffold protein [Pyrinomonadaceae bacterium]|nr:iron-sulfur cluster assembly scaffold protein [Pyrinomonadaceae bacterium]